MFFRQKTDPTVEFFSGLIALTAQSIGRPVEQSVATRLAQDLLARNSDSCVAVLGAYALVPIAYHAVRNWRGCSAGTCNSFYSQMRPFGWESLAPIETLLNRPVSVSQAHYRMWEGVLKPQGISLSGIKSEFEDAERYLSHMILHATTDLVYGQTGSFGNKTNMPVSAKVHLMAIVTKSDSMRFSDNFVLKELDGLKRAIQSVS